jgi:hypothetical protein
MKQGKHFAACWLVAALLVGGSGCAATASATRLQKETAPQQDETAAAPDSTVGNTAAELRRLMDAHQLTELRTTYNGTYGASLLFHADSLNYYVTLFHDKEFWRVIRTSSNDSAEQVYRTFVQQTEQLSKVYLDTVRLQAGKRYTERMVEINEKRLAGLQQEAEQQRQAAAQVTAALQQNKQEAVTLSSDLQSSSAQLEALNRRIDALQQAQIDPTLNLPAPPATTAPAPAVVPQDGQQQ